MREILVFIFGAVIGSFLNVCIYRLPKEESVVSPRSYCPQCKKPIAGFDNIPLLSYILLLGKCRSCKAKIPFRYFLVELFTALLFLALFKRYQLSLEFFAYAVFVSALIVSAVIDIQARLIYSVVTYAGIILGLLFNAARGISLSPWAFNYRPALDSLFGIIAGGGIIYLTGKTFNFFWFGLLKKPPIDGEKESMGFGDVELLAMIGAFLGWQKAVLTFFLAPFFGAIVGIINLLVKKEHTIPYGPFLSLAAVLSLFWADKIIKFLFFR
ncbi:MAG: prepilin peptidase [Candidatus Omnitrophica bacterium]|nr:prepilin peptidase [Candidatus Omnitrophota bacterium]MDD5236739.1 prepilin peptidase [Candidatus Omnitrophota bacterium]MDD5610300.1 prepilin peptidase [Candidatus Omnitrophota bacterium]